MKTVVGVSGSWGTVEFLADERGVSELKATFDALELGEHAALHASMQLLADTGRIRNEQKFKNVEKGIWEFRRFQQRFLGFFTPGRRFIIASHEVKKKDRLSRMTIERAMEISMRFAAEEARKCKTVPMRR